MIIGGQRNAFGGLGLTLARSRVVQPQSAAAVFTRRINFRQFIFETFTGTDQYVL